MKNIKPLIILLLSLRFAANVNAQTSTTYSILSTAYDRSTGGYFPLGSVDNYWFLTKTQNMSVPLDPSTILTYPDNPTYIVQNSGNNVFSGIIANHSINTNTTTISNGQKVITYRTYFNLPVSTSKSYSLSFKMCADDAVDTVKLNGVAKGVFLGPSFNNIPGVTKPYLLEISACDTSFRTGQNFIDISIADAGGSVGFYAEIILSEISNACLSQVGIEEHSMQGSFFSIHPNPAHASLNINLNTQFIKEITKTVSFKIFSIDGKLIKTEEINKTALSQYIINTSDLNNGLYYLTITSGNYSQNFKFIKE